MKFLPLIILCSLLFPLRSFAESRIASIIVKGARRDAHITEIRRALGFSEGELFDPNTLVSAKKRIENSSIFRAANITAQESDKGTSIVVEVQLEPVISNVVISAPDDLKLLLESRLSILKDERFSEADIRKMIDDLNDSCQKMGYFQAELTYAIEALGNNETLLHVNARENQRAQIGSVVIRAPNQRLMTEVSEYLDIDAPDAPYRRDKMMEAMKSFRTWQSGRGYFDAHIRLVSEDYSSDTNKVQLVLEVELGPLYEPIFSGVTYFSTRFLKNEITRLLSIHESVIPPKQRVRAHLTNIYRRHGFINVNVEVESPLSIRVAEGAQHLISRIEVTGMDPLNAQDIAGRIRELLKQNYDASPSNDPPSVALDGLEIFDERALSRSRSQLQDELVQKGYLSAKISAPQIDINPKNRFVTTTFRVTLGERTLIEAYDIDAFGLTRKADLERCIDFHKERPLIQNSLEAPRACMEEQLWNNGYPYAQVLADTDLSKESARAKIKFKVRPGPLVVIDNVELRGLSATKPSTMLSRIDIPKGSPFSLQKIATTRQVFLNSDIFDRVDVYTEAAKGGDTERTLVIDVHERSRTSIELGAGASLEDGPRVSLLTTHRNLFGWGMNARNRLQVNYPALFYGIPFLYPPKYLQALENRFKEDSPFWRALLYTEGKLSASLDYPYILTSPWHADAAADLSLSRELKISYTLNKIGVETGLTIKPTPQFRFGPNLQYEFAKFYCPIGYKEGLGCGDGALDPATRRIDTGSTHQFTFKLAGSLDGRDSLLRPKNGYFMDTSAELGLGRADLGSLDSFRAVRYIKLLGSFNVFRPLSKSATWQLTFKFGQIFELTQDDYVPLFKRFYLGGTNSIRGFAEDQILPADDANWPADSFRPRDPHLPALSLGGDAFVLLRGEIRFPFSSEHDGAVFIDAGELLRSTSNFTLSGLAVGAGFGIRYLTPIGPLMLDLGIRIVDGVRSYNSGFWQLFGVHFSIGYF